MPSSFCRRQLSTRCALTLTPCLRLALPSPPPPLQPPPPALVPLRAARCFPPPAQDEVKEFFGDPYSMQMYGIVFGYLSIARMTVSYQRYWEGVTHVKTMHAKWMESFSQVIVFDRIDELEARLRGVRDERCVLKEQHIPAAQAVLVEARNRHAKLSARLAGLHAQTNRERDALAAQRDASETASRALQDARAQNRELEAYARQALVEQRASYVQLEESQQGLLSS